MYVEAMGELLVGTVEALFRYPVKSMQGERLSAAQVGSAGLVGDRAFAVREPQGTVLTAKRTKELLGWSASFGECADPGDLSPLITAPDGQTFEATDDTASARLSERLGRDVIVERAGTNAEVFGELDADTLFAGIPAAQVLEGKPRQLPAGADRYGLATGTFFDSAHLHLLATGTLDHLGSLIGEDADTSVCRFRPNILVRTGDVADLGDQGWVEDAWMGHQLRIGSVEVSQIWPTLRCVMTTVAQADVARDLRVLKTIVREHDTDLGAFATTSVPGEVRVGDPVVLIT